jgi:hypothetical protein
MEVTIRAETERTYLLGDEVPVIDSQNIRLS